MTSGPGGNLLNGLHNLRKSVTIAVASISIYQYIKIIGFHALRRSISLHIFKFPGMLNSFVGIIDPYPIIM